MNKYIHLLLILSSLSAQGNTDGQKDIIAMADIEYKGISEGEAEKLHSWLQSALTNSNAYTVTERAKVRKILKEVKLMLKKIFL